MTISGQYQQFVTSIYGTYFIYFFLSQVTKVFNSYTVNNLISQKNG